jgi:branched-chain amino acid transport system permease protein
VLRLKSDYLAIATLGFAEIIRAIVPAEALGPVTNGSKLLRGFPTFTNVTVPFAFIVGMVHRDNVIVLLINSTYGRAFKAIRDDEIAAEAMGINLARHKRWLRDQLLLRRGGRRAAGHVPDHRAGHHVQVAMTYEILLIVVIGGIGSVSGSCISSFLFIACSEWWLRFLDTTQYIGAFKVPLLRRLPHGGVLRRHHDRGAVLPPGHHGRQGDSLQAKACSDGRLQDREGGRRE